MAGSRPGESNGGPNSVAAMFMPLPDSAISFVRDYDVKGVGAMLAKVSHCSLDVQMDTLRKGLEQFKKPNAIGRIIFKEGKTKDEEEEGEESDIEDVDDKMDEDEDDEVGEDEDKETLKLMVDDNKPATNGQLQVPNEGERVCKKPKISTRLWVPV